MLGVVAGDSLELLLLLPEAQVAQEVEGGVLHSHCLKVPMTNI